MKHYPSVTYSQCYTLSLNTTHFEEKHGSEELPSRIDLVLYLDEVNAPIISQPGIEVSGTAGGVVILHQSGQLPVLDSAVLASAGQKTSIKIKKRKFKRLNDEQDQCINHGIDGVEIQDLSGRHFNYSQTGCLFQILQDLIVRNCGCIHSDYGVGPLNHNINNLRFCGSGISNLTQMATELE